MCFSKKIGRHTFAKYVSKIALTDIECYKIVLKYHLDSAYVSIFQRMRYEKDVVYSTLLCATIDTVCGETYLQIEKGFHSYKFCSWAIKNNFTLNGIVITFIIPKGSEYYENENEYVSNQIKRAY